MVLFTWTGGFTKLPILQWLKTERVSASSSGTKPCQVAGWPAKAASDSCLQPCIVFGWLCTNPLGLSKENYNKEFNTIKQIALQLHNKFNMQKVHKLNNKIKMKLKLKIYTTLQHPKWIKNRFGFRLLIGGIYLRSLKTILKKTQNQYYTQNTE